MELLMEDKGKNRKCISSGWSEPDSNRKGKERKGKEKERNRRAQGQGERGRRRQVVDELRMIRTGCSRHR